MAMFNKYQDDDKLLSQINANVFTFGANIVIDEEFDEPFCEEEY